MSLIKHESENRQLVDIDKSKTVIKRILNKQYNAHSSAQKLAVPAEWLKKVIPCTHKCSGNNTDDSSKEEYYWSVELISILCRIKSNDYSDEDLKYVAKHCCKGDMKWAKRIIDALISPMKYVTLNSEPNVYPLNSGRSNVALKNKYPLKKR